MRFGVLGTFELGNGDVPVALRPPKLRTLLALLLSRANRPIATDRLVLELWGTRPPRTASKILQVYVHQIRRALGDKDRIRWWPTGYEVVVHPGELDAHRFEELARRGYELLDEGDVAGARMLFSEAEALWRGPAFDGFQAGLLRDEAAIYEERRLNMLERRIAADLMLGHQSDVVAELLRLVTDHPLRERFREQLMLALYRSGRQAEALQAYRRGRDVLADELGIDPGPELRRLERAILTCDPTIGPATRSLAARQG